MADIQVQTDGTITGTKLIVDGNEVTKKEKVISISMYASAPYKSKYSGEVIQGYASCSYEVANDNGTIERKSYGTTETAFSAGIGTKVSSNDSIVRFIGHKTDKELTDLVDRIVSHCEKASVKCPDREVLLSRSIESLKDKATDLGISLEDKASEVILEPKEEGKK